MINFEPVSNSTKDRIVKMIRDNASEVEEGGWPGVPADWMPLSLRDNLQAVIAEGRVHVHEVTKPSKIDPTELVTYTYLVVADQ